MTTPTTRPGFDRDTAMALAAAEGERFVDVVSGLAPEEWEIPTECKPWTVRDTANHVLGNHEALRSFRRRLVQIVRARRKGGNVVDALSSMHIADRADLSPDAVVERLRAAFPQSIAGRRALPRAVRSIRSSVPMHRGKETWSLAYLEDIIYTRDTWMHRMDICRAVGLAPTLTAEHDGRIVADIVHEWAARHGQPYHLTLTGVAGGTFGGTDGQLLELDAVEFCRLLSGRGDVPVGQPLLAVEVGY